MNEELVMEVPSPKGGSSAPRSRTSGEIRTFRVNRTAEVLQVKDEQIRLITEQNEKLLEAVASAEDEINTIQVEKLRVEEENRSLTNIQSKVMITDGELETIRSQSSRRENELKIMTSQNEELLRLLETEEANNAKLASESENANSEVRELKGKYSVLGNASRIMEELTKKHVSEERLKSEEIRLLRVEIESVKSKKNEDLMKTSVELDSLQEQLRVRKGKQCQLLEKLQNQEEARRYADDQVLGLEEKIKELHTKSTTSETQLQLEINSKLKQEELNRKLTFEFNALFEDNKDLKSKLHMVDQARIRIESEARDSGEQLREMAEKVFQLLERLKLAELGKSRSIEALKAKEHELNILKRKNSHIVKESAKEGNARVKTELDKKVLEDQIRATKKYNLQLGQRCKEEAKRKIRAEDGMRDAQEKVNTLNGRLSFLLNKLHTEEEANVVKEEEISNIRKQIETKTESCEKLQHNFNLINEKTYNLTHAIINKDEEVQASKIKFEALQQHVVEQDEMREEQRKRAIIEIQVCGKNDNVTEGRLRFSVDNKPTIGVLALKGQSSKDRMWLEESCCNIFLRKAFKNRNTEELLVKKLAELYGMNLTLEEMNSWLRQEVKRRKEELETIKKKMIIIYNRLGLEEEAKRRILLRYINAVKASVSLGEPGCEKDRIEVGRVGAGQIRLPESNLTDEEVHAIAAMLQENQTIVELNLQGNRITDDGCRAIASILSGKTSLQVIDLKRNRISYNGIKIIAENLERSERVKHVYVHAGGKVEALGSQFVSSRNMDNVTINNQTVGSKCITQICDKLDTVCTVDIRENSTEKYDILHDDIGFLVSDESVMPGSKIKFHSECALNKVPRIIKSNGIIIKKNDISSKLIPEDQTKQAQMQGVLQHQNIVREQGWIGRAGGLDMSPSKNINKNNSQTIKKIVHEE